MFNLVVVLIGTFFLAAILIYFISKHDKKMRDAEALRSANESSSSPALNFRSFMTICQDLCDSLKLDISEITQPSGGEFSIRAFSRNPITRVEFLLAGFHLPQKTMLETGRIMEISDQVVSERISKAIIVTTGMIDRQAALSLPELAPMEFIDGTELARMMRDKEIFS